MLVCDLLARYRATLKCRRPETVDCRLAHLRRLLGSLDADSLRGHHLSDYRVQRLAEGVCDSTANRELSVLKAAFRRGLDDEVIDRMPRIRLESEPPPRERFLTIDGLERLCQALQEPVYRDVVRYLFHSGWRKKSTLQLPWEAVKPTMVVLPASSSKNNRPVVFPRVGEVDRIICRREQNRLHGCPWVFHRDGREIRDFRRSWQKAVDEIGEPGLIIHDLRRSFAHWQLRCGIPREVTMKLGGWRSDSMYRRYAIVDENLLVSALTQSEEFLRKGG